jgi:hypothetical protein
MRSRFVTLALVCLSPIGCTRGVVDIADIPTAPPVPPVRAVRLTIAPIGGGSMLVGDRAPLMTSGTLPGNSVPLGAFAEFDNGEGRYVEASWTSSDDSVIAVIDHALVARAPGSATLTARFEGQADNEAFTVGAGIFGRWSGTYVVEQCVANSGSMQDVLCRQAAPPARTGLAALGATLPFAVEITAVSGDDISGRVFFGMLTATFAGKNHGGGFFSLTGAAAGQGGTINLIDWHTRVVDDGMAGLVAYDVKLDGVAGIGGVAARLASVTRQP